MKCLIVDDEPLARELLESYIEKVEGLTLVKSVGNALEAFSCIEQRPIDIVFLDIHMPLITGLDLLKTMKAKPKVILTTAYREHAIEAYELDVVDYLLKPILFERFLKSISKIYQFKQPLNYNSDQNLLTHSFDQAYIYLKEDRQMVKVFLNDILYIESLKDYVRVKTKDKQVITYQKISYLEHKLPENKFLRVHRSYIVAFEKVKSFTSNTVTVDFMEIPIGRNYKTEVMKVLNRNNILNEK